MIEEFATYVGTNVVSLTLGTDLKLFMSESDPDTCLYLVERSGGEINPYQTDHRALAVEITSRSLDFHTARDRSYDVLAALNGKCGIVLPTVHSGQEYLVQSIQVFTAPIYQGTDKSGRHLWSSDLLVRAQDNPS